MARTPDEIERRSRNAKLILGDEVWDELRTSYLFEIENSRPEDRDRREDLYKSIRVLQDVRERISQRVNDKTIMDRKQARQAA